MWNSNSMISWLIARTGLDVDAITPPAGGRAPGWDAGVVVATRASVVVQAPRQSRTALIRSTFGHKEITDEHT